MIPFNKPYLTGKELHYINEANSLGKLAGDGSFTNLCSAWIEQRTGCQMALLTHSCTAALEMAAILAEIKPGDEIIMPSFTFVSTANAFVLRGGIPVFVDIRQDTLNIDETLIEAAITKKTKVIVPVHYAGVACEMDVIMDIASRHNLLVIEDAAQAICSTYKGKALGSIGHLGCYSFHETKNIISGEGGALLINDQTMTERAVVIRDKGTNRRNFLNGNVDKYTWVDIGSSYLMGEYVAAFLWAQLQEAEQIVAKRHTIWNTYHDAFKSFELKNRILRPRIPIGAAHNAHIYYLLLDNIDDRNSLISEMRQHGIHAVFHYIPLHSSPGGRIYSKNMGNLFITDSYSNRLVRLPMFIELASRQKEVISAVSSYLKNSNSNTII